MSRRGGLIAAAAIAVLAMPASAGATPITFGADLSNTPAQSSNIYSFAPVIDPGGMANTGAPTGGILVSVRIKTTGAAGTGTIRVLTQTSHPDSMTYGFRNTAPEIPIPFAADATPAGHVTEVLTRRPINAGDKLGWYFNDPTNSVKESYNDFSGECAYTGTPHPVGTTVNYFTPACNSNIILESGTIEADADGDGFGDDTQDHCPTDASTQGTCPVAAPPPTFAPVTPSAKKKCKKKHKRSPTAAKKCKKRR
jgi:hypothetical protein